MNEQHEEIIVGILGQWASGKTTAASTLVSHLGGEDEVAFITDRELLAGQVVKYILELENDQVRVTMEEDGSQRLAGKHASVCLDPGEDLKTKDLNDLLFDLHDDGHDDVLPTWCAWFVRARVEIGNQIRERSAEGKPIVIEAGFGTNTEPTGANPFCHTISDLFVRLQEGGVEPNRVKWIIVEASYDIRSVRNEKRPDTVPAVEFDRYAADGGDLDPDQQSRLEAQGTAIKRVPNEHDDKERFKADIIAAFDELFERQVAE